MHPHTWTGTDLPDDLSEAKFQSVLVNVAVRRGWRVQHLRPVTDRNGRTRTAIQGHRGFPDLVLARAGRVIVAELKSRRGRLAPEQKEWLAALTGGAVEVYVWRPADWPDIVRTLGTAGAEA